MHNIRHYPNPTPPARCDAMVVGDSKLDLPPIKCIKRVFKAGMCIEHYNTWVNAKDQRRLTVTRHRQGIYDGLTYYSTRASEKNEGNELSLMTGEWCVGKDYRCPNRPIINMDNKLYCQRCFMRVQRKMAIKAKKAEQTAA